MDDADRSWAAEAASAVWKRLHGSGWSGYDPYDGCLAKRVPGWACRSGLAGRLVTQTVKRSPISLQPVLGVPSDTDAYTLGHALLAVTRLADQPNFQSAESDAALLLEQLRRTAWRRGSAWGWGYHFPVHTRFFSYVPPTPNVIVTAFVAKGLAAATRAGLADCRAELRGAAAFVLQELPRVEDETGDCIGYVPGERVVVHNANMLAAHLLCEAAEACEEPVWVEQAVRCAHFSASKQLADGAWPYSEEKHGRWVDGFHTGFTLEGLARVERAHTDDVLVRTLGRGLAYYVAQLFGPSGEPKYYPQRSYPHDALSAAQGLETLQVALQGVASEAVPGQLDWVRRHMVRPNGEVAYRVHRIWTDWRPFPRWSSSPMLSALAGVAQERGSQ